MVARVQTAGRPESGDFDRYLDFMDSQLRELLTGYGEIGGIWFDGMWDKPNADWRLDRTYGLIHSLQPAALIGSNHHLLPFPTARIFRCSRKICRVKRPRSSTLSRRSGNLPLETCDTINNAWGYNNRRQALQKHRAADSISGASGGLQRQLPAEHRTDAQRKDPT